MFRAAGATAGLLLLLLQSCAHVEETDMGAFGYAEEVELAGRVVETMESGGYTYVLLDSDGRQIWVAIWKTPVEEGREVRFKPAIRMTDFESPTLKRTFDEIYFSGGLYD